MTLTPALRDTLSPGFLCLSSQPGASIINHRARQLLGLGEEENAIEKLPPTLTAVLDHSLQNHQDLHNYVLFLPPAQEAQTKSLLVSSYNVPGPNGPTLCVVLNDVTPARQLEQKMQLLDRLASIGTLSASMAHEIKNALVAIKTFVDLLLKHNQDSELAGIVARELKRIDSIVSQMLRFAGPAKPTFANVRVHQLLNHVLRLLQHQTQGRELQMRCEFNAHPDTIHGDDYQLEQAFVNLLLNAVAATPPNGQITLSTEIRPPVAPDHPSQLAVRLQDTGTGISKENLDRLFEPFFTTKTDGTGLGLAITQRIVRDHRGTVSVQSEVNQGTTFELLFPLPKSQPKAR